MEAAARQDSLVLRCRQNGVEPETYVTDLLGRIATAPNSEFSILTPLGWAAGRAAGAVG